MVFQNPSAVYYDNFVHNSRELKNIGVMLSRSSKQKKEWN